MSYDFNIDEILAMAEKIEKNGAAFYRKSAESVSGSPNKELLLELAGMEEQHEKTFASLRAELSADEKAPTTFDPDNETALYLKALADIRIFFNKEIDTTSIKEILKEALVAEKDSIVFYLGMKDLVSEKSGKSRIDAIIREEMGHIRLLGRKLLDL